MNVDLLIAGIIAAMAIWGAITGVAKQIASLASVILAYFLAHPIATYLGPHVAKAFHVRRGFGTVAATLGAFILVVILVRLLLTPLLRHALAGKEPDDRRLDRALGLLFGALKSAAFAWVVLSCLTYAEDNLTLAGRKLGLTPKESVLFGAARRFNLVTMTHFAPVEDLVTVANATTDPKKLQRLKSSPAFQALQRDLRFHDALGDAELRRAFRDDDAQTLLQSNAVLELVQDPKTAERLREAAQATQ